jgi:beta-glucosidase
MRSLFSAIILTTILVPAMAQNKAAFRTATLPVDARVNDLLKQLTLPEKISLLGYRSKAVPRLGIPAYNWWNEALHGVARAGNATIFPQAIGMAATFNNELMLQSADAISTEARAKYNLAVKKDQRLQYMGLTFWSPNINIFRDPRWGRGQETYGEDPFLTATMGSAFVRGMQGNDKNHLKTAACAKHLAVHSGPEKDRHTFNAIVNEKDLRETYLYAFKKLVDNGTEAVMCAYNRVNGEPCCTGNTLLRSILRDEWKFKGHVVTDCWALEDIFSRHKVLPDGVQTAAAAIKAGVNMDCSNLLQDDVMKAVERKLLTEQEVDSALAPVLRTQIKLGFFDDAAVSPYASYGEDSVANEYHRSLSRTMAQQSLVLLKNDKNILPLDKNKYPAIMIVGPNAASIDVLMGNYHGVSDKAVNFVEGITKAVDAGTRIEYDMGCDYRDTTHFGGIWAASNANVTIAVLGFTPVYEGEDGDAFLADGGGDKKNLSLPAAHIAFLKALRKGTKTPIITVINSGGAVDISAIAPYSDAIIMAWYPGQEGGNALADILFGKVSPSGRLPVTFYNSFSDLPAYDDYNMQGRTYRYYSGRVQYPFGFGLSYTSFAYEWIKQPVLNKDEISFSIKLKNTGNHNGDEVVQVYIEYPSLPGMPVKELKAFRRLPVNKNGEAQATFSIPVSELKKWDLQNRTWQLYQGNYKIVVGGHSVEERLSATLPVKGYAVQDKRPWKQLFNGKNLDGWMVKIRGKALNDNSQKTFVVKDGVMKVDYSNYKNFDDQFGHIYYKTPFSHYLVAVEYRFVGEQATGGPGWAKRNSGIMLHCQPPSSILKDQDFPISIEVQFLGGDSTGVRTTCNLCTPGTHVEMNNKLVTDHCINSRSKTFRGDQWVRAEVLVLGDSVIKHIVNGDTVLVYQKPQLGGGVVSNFDPAFKKDGQPLKGGYIALQSESHPIEFRKVEIINLEKKH